jgi:hypothetical protein
MVVLNILVLFEYPGPENMVPFYYFPSPVIDYPRSSAEHKI